jgi:hypothetical protein
VPSGAARRSAWSVNSLVAQGSYAEADTLTTANNLALYLSYQGKYAQAERIQREVHAVRKRVLEPAVQWQCAGRPSVASHLRPAGARQRHWHWQPEGHDASVPRRPGIRTAPSIKARWS